MIKRLAAACIPFVPALSLILLVSVILVALDTSGKKSSGGKLPRVAIVQHASQAALDESVEGIVAGLADAGYINGKTMVLKKFNAQGDLPTANDIALQVTNGSTDLVITSSTPSLQAVANANRQGKVRHVYGVVTDAASSGVGVSATDPLDHPPHLTGMSVKIPVLNALKLVLQANPNLKTIGLVWHTAEVNSQIYTEDMRKACAELGLTLLEANAENSSAVGEAARSLVARGVDALFITGDVVVLVAAEAVIAAARSGGIPVVTIIPGNYKKGALFDYGANFMTVGLNLGTLAARVLQGEDTAKIPTTVEVPEKITINLTALNGLRDRWQIPPEMLAKADAYIDTDGQEQVRAATTIAPAAAAPGNKKIGIIYFAPEEGADLALRGLIEGLGKNHYVEGRNLEVKRTHAQGEIANIPMLVQNFDNQDIDLIVTLTTPVLTSASAMARNKPVVFTYVYDPVAAGAGTSLADHLPHVTGVGSFPPVEDTVELIAELVPGVEAVGTVYNSSEANSRKVVEVARDIFKRAGIRLEEVTVTTTSDIHLAVQSLTQRGIQAVWVTGDNTVLQAFDAVVKVTTEAQLPLVINDPEFIARGALAAVGLGWYEAGFAGGEIASRVLAGESPADIPFSQVAVKKITLNDAMAKKLGITFPAAMLESAAQIIR